MPKLSGVVDVAAGMIGSIPIKKLTDNGVKLRSIRKLNGMDMDAIRKLPTDDPLRASANALLEAEKKLSFTSRAKAGAKSGFRTVKSTCGKNIALCAGVGIAGYTTYKSYQDLSEEKKQCSGICMPDDWEDFKKGRKARPTYKTRDAVSPYDPSLRYEALYPDNEDIVCTTTNMMEDGINPAQKDSCDKFCQNVCDFTLGDVLTNVPATGANMLTDIFKDIFGSVFGDSAKWAMIASGGLSSLILFLIVFIVVLKQ